MKSLLIVLAVLSFGFFCYKRRSSKDSKQGKEAVFLKNIPELEIEQIEQLSLADVVEYFKGLKLEKGRDIPFIANVSKIQNLFKIDFSLANCIFFATYNEESGKLENYKCVETNSVDQKLLDVLGNEKLVVLN